MITCYINGKVTYPAAQSDIKITLLNPFIKDGDEKSMEVVFPMSIPENLEVFGSINRLDTHFRQDNFEDCRLTADGIEIIQGTGTITSVTNTEVKLQILSGKSYLRYKASFDNIYIDEIYYGDLMPRHQHFYNKPQSTWLPFNLANDINNYGFIGEPGYYAFLPIYDETNDHHMNMPTFLFLQDEEHWTQFDRSVGYNISFRAIQPNLMYVMRKVIETLGYRLESNYYEREPWNRIYVASAKLTLVMSRALPHWSAYKFLDEFRKLFNATYIFDEQRKTVSIIPFGESGNMGSETIEPLEDFSTSFDEEGVEYIGSSNLEYELSDSDRDFDFISQDVMKAFDFQEYDSFLALNTAFLAMTQKQKLTTIFHCPVGYFYGIPVYDEQEENIINYQLKECGWFSPLVRQEGGSTVTLKIVPVAMQAQKVHAGARVVINWKQATGVEGFVMLGGQEYEFDGYEANIECDYHSNAAIQAWTSADVITNDLDYITVQDVIENGESLPDRSSEDTIMQIFFASGTVLTAPDKNKTGFDTGDDYTFTCKQAVPFTDYRQAIWSAMVPTWGLGLTQVQNVTSVGQFHNKGIRIRQNVNGNNEICIRFLFDGKPDPRKIYMMKNRKFICSKIEMAVGDNGIDRVKTGYFYEML